MAEIKISGARILVQEKKLAAETSSGIIIPEREKQKTNMGIVIQVGDLRYMPHGPKDHQELISKLRRAFNTRLVTNDEVDAPLSELWKNKRQVLLIYKNQQINIFI